MREFTVVLPRLNVAGALALSQSIVSVGETVEQLPAPIGKALKKLANRYGALKSAAAGKIAVSDAASTPAAREADSILDACWSSLFSWGSGWARLPGEQAAEESSEAGKLIAVVYSDGLKFTLLPYKLEWAESETRIERIKSQGFDKVIDRLGGKKFFTALTAAHAAYGEVLGITAAAVAAEEGVDLRAPLEALAKALRTYVVRVQAHIDDDDPASAELADKLLAPIVDWETRSASPAATESQLPSAPPAPPGGTPA
jgi:hypothetical protein